MARRGHTNIDSMQDESPLGLQASFIEGLKTEFTGLNFPPNAATDTDNCVFTMLGDVTRRKGFDYELDYQLASLGDRTGAALNTYVWRNAGGDGESILFVAQVATSLYFYVVTDTTSSSPLSNHKLSSTVDLTQYVVAGSARNFECQFADGNGYLFVYNNACNPVYCTYDPIAKTVTSNAITIKVRDFTGVTSEAPNNPTTRVNTLSSDHDYNLRNQGWSRAPLWTVTANDNLVEYTKMGDGSETIPQSFTGNGVIGLGVVIGDHPFTFPAGEPISTGTPVDIQYSIPCWIYDIKGVNWTTGAATGKANGVVKSYNTLTGVAVVSVTFTEPVLHADNLEYGANPGGGGILGPIQYTISSAKSINTIDTFFGQIGLYPSNADIWWIFKDEKDDFSPATTVGNKGLPTAWSPKGHFILNAFNQDRTAATNEANSFASQVTGLQTIVTSKRPTNGTWFQGRVWYAGVDDSQQAAGDQSFYTWTENIYFSRIVESVADFGSCHEDNDPTDQYSFNLLPSDGGVITIQGAGAIFRLFPIQNGMLVFAANGIWFITGSQGIGFSASDYTITKISEVRSISNNSFVNVNGLPIFWNEEGVYTVAPAQQGLGLTVNPLTVGTIKSFYDKIPLSSKKLARGSYNPIDYVVQWVYKQTATISAPAGGIPYFYTMDDSCHQYNSNDLGNNWTENLTPNIHDDWSDLIMAINDQDYTTLMSTSQNNLSHGNYGISTDRGTTGSWTVYNPKPTHKYVSGAITAGARTIMLTPSTTAVGGDSTAYPTISYDGGTTFTDIQPLGSGEHFFGRVAFSTAGSVMYMTRAKVGSANIWKSVDHGVTWTELTNSPVAQTGINTEECRMRLRCSSNGAIVVYTDIAGHGGDPTQQSIWVSRDFGATWTETLLPSPSNFMTNGYADISLSRNGSVILYVNSDAAFPGPGENVLCSAFLSKDGGLTWTDISLRLPNNTINTNGGILNSCAVSPDGTSMFAIYDVDGNHSAFTNHSFVDVSSDGGTTWTGHEFFGDPTDFGAGAASLGIYTGSYAVDPVQVVPLPSTLTPAQLIAQTYEFNKVLNYNTHTGAFYPWTISTDPISTVTTPRVHAVDYVQGPGGTDDPPAIFKYFTSVLNNDGTYSYTFSEATDPTYVDWDYATETTGDVYSSYFITGYSLFGQGLRKFQPLYLEMFSRLNETNMKYSIEGLWDFATAGNSGKWSTRQVISLDKPNFGMAFKRHKIRGNGYALQLKVSSVDNSPFDIMGWNMQVTQNAGM